MVEVFLICVLAASIVGGVAAPIARILLSTYSEERKRLESGGQPVFPESYIHPEAFEEMKAPPKSPRQREEVPQNQQN